MNIQFKWQNALIVYGLMIWMTYIWKQAVPVSELITTAISVGFMFFCANWFRQDTTMDLMKPLIVPTLIFCYTLLAVGLALSGFVWHIVPLTVLQYAGFMVTIAFVYYFVDTAFDD